MLKTLIRLVSFERPMDFLFTPWRYAYVTAANNPGGCLFCDIFKAQNDEQNFVVHRGKLCFVILNTLPYSSGHVMVVPYETVVEHLRLSTLDTTDMIELM